MYAIKIRGEFTAMVHGQRHYFSGNDRAVGSPVRAPARAETPRDPVQARVHAPRDAGAGTGSRVSLSVKNELPHAGKRNIFEFTEFFTPVCTVVLY